MCSHSRVGYCGSKRRRERDSGVSRSGDAATEWTPAVSPSFFPISCRREGEQRREVRGCHRRCFCAGWCVACVLAPAASRVTASVGQDRGSGYLWEIAEVVRMWAKRQHDGGVARTRLHKAETPGGSPVTVSEYTHNGLEIRIGWHADVEWNDPRSGRFCDERWRSVAAHRGSGASTIESFVYHNAVAKGCRGAYDGASSLPCRPFITVRHRSPSGQGLRWHDFSATRHL